MSKWISVLVLAGALMAQGPLPSFYREATELLPASAVVVTDPSNVSVVRTSSTVLTIGSGASSTAPQTVRAAGANNGEFYPRQYTSANTLTSTAGGSTGTIWIYALPATGSGTTVTSFSTVVISNLGGTLTCTGSPTCVVVSSQSATGRQAIGRGVYLAAATMTAGSPATFDSGGVTLQTRGINGWVRSLTIANVTGSAVTVSLADGKGLAYGDALSIAANTTYELELGKPGYERFFERGLSVTASAASSVNLGTRWITPKLVYSPAAPQ